MGVRVIFLPLLRNIFIISLSIAGTACIANAQTLAIADTSTARVDSVRQKDQAVSSHSLQTRTRVWIAIGGGVAGGLSTGNPAAVTSFVLDYDWKDLLFMGRYLYMENIIGSNSMAAHTQPEEIALLAGYQYFTHNIYTSVAAGVGVFRNYYIADQSKFNNNAFGLFESPLDDQGINSYITPGFALHARTALTIYAVAFSVEGYANINPRASFYGAGLSVMFGKLW